MNETVDARGFSCPQPVMMLVKKMKEMKTGSFDILVDDETAGENVCRTAEGKGWLIRGINNIEDYSKISVCTK
ncbi:MAG: sulfurtransferase TusA family protein [Candidatus Omnitrophica bacterium]|nr:sulfurtransferase TusA family protein [Candidatus Omnitrophota bacterium]